MSNAEASSSKHRDRKSKKKDKKEAKHKHKQQQVRERDVAPKAEGPFEHRVQRMRLSVPPKFSADWMEGVRETLDGMLMR